MLKIFLKMLDIEKDMIFSERAKGKFVVRPSSAIMLVFALLYLLSPIDIIPEGLISPKICGFIDDLAILILTGYVVYLDVGGEFNGSNRVSNGKVQTRGKRSGQSGISNKNKSVLKGDDVTDTSDGMLSNVSSKQGVSGSIRSSSDRTVHDDNNSDNTGNINETNVEYKEELFIEDEESKFVL